MLGKIDSLILGDASAVDANAVAASDVANAEALLDEVDARVVARHEAVLEWNLVHERLSPEAHREASQFEALYRSSLPVQHLDA
jgi:hypothetical protein